jgi:hypothetical protein
MSYFPVSGRTLFIAALSLFAVTNLASARDSISCRSFAEAAADEWSAGRLVPADSAELPNSNEIVLISAGHKYLVPRAAQRADSIILQPLGQLATDRNIVYEEELRRCLHTRELNIYVNR